MQAHDQPQTATKGSSLSHPTVLAPYSFRHGWTYRDEVKNKNAFLWEDQSGRSTHILEIWPEDPPDTVTWLTERDATSGAEVERIDSKEHIELEGSEELGEEGASGPLRLYDCENMVLKTRQDYLKETMGTVPPYVIVSQVWGAIRESMEIPTVPWPVPISNKKKWIAILEFCKKQHVKWIWLDIICINQSRTPEAEIEKGDEIPSMKQYYRDSAACLVIPHNYKTFSSAYKCVMEIFSSFVDSGASVKDNARAIWDGIAMVEKVADDSWFWRVWTYQEQLLPKKHILLDGQELYFDRLERCLTWYYNITSNGILEKPKGGTVYEFVNVTGFGFEAKPWGTLVSSWKMKATLEKDGYIDFLPAVAITDKRQCTFPIDRLLGIYGMLKEDDRVPLHEPNPDFATETNISEPFDEGPSSILSDHHSAHTSPSRQLARLERLWERTVVKAMEEGRVWPLLYDGMVANPPRGTNWIPRITDNPLSSHEVHDVCDQRNWRKVTVTRAGAQLTVRVVGRMNGVSVEIGDGDGEINKTISCAWALVAKGFNAQPIVQMFQSALASVSPDTIEHDQTRLNQALHAPSLVECFYIAETENLRDRLFRAGGIAGWHRAVFTAQSGPSYSGADGTYIFLGWICNKKAVDKQCWILDVTADPQGAKRWVIANKTGPNTFHKIGSVVTNALPALTKDDGYAVVVLE